MKKTMKHTTPITKTLAAAGLAGILMISASGLPSAHVHAETKGCSEHESGDRSNRCPATGNIQNAAIQGKMAGNQY